MKENFISRPALIATTLWVVTVLLLGAVWGLALFDAAEGRWGRPMAVLACVTSCGALASQLRVHAMRLCAVIRATSGAEATTPSADVRALR